MIDHPVLPTSLKFHAYSTVNLLTAAATKTTGWSNVHTASGIKV